MQDIKTVSLIGLGGVGTYMATRLQPTLGKNFRIVASGERRNRIIRDGVIANGEKFFFNVVGPDDNTGYADLAIITTKFMGLRSALEDMKNQIGPDTLVLAPLNGVEAESIAAEYYPAENILPSLMFISAVRDGNSSTFDTGFAHIQFGEYNNEVTERVTKIKELFERVGINVQIPKDIIRAKWLKLMINVSQNLSSAVLGLTYYAWSGISPSATYIREELAREVLKVAQAQGINLTEEDIMKRRKHLLTFSPAGKPSTLQDIEAGRHTEVDIFAGTIIKLGKQYGIPTPYNEMFYHMIKVLEEKNDGLFVIK